MGDSSSGGGGYQKGSVKTQNTYLGEDANQRPLQDLMAMLGEDMAQSRAERNLLFGGPRYAGSFIGAGSQPGGGGGDPGDGGSGHGEHLPVGGGGGDPVQGGGGPGDGPPVRGGRRLALPQGAGDPYPYASLTPTGGGVGTPLPGDGGGQPVGGGGGQPGGGGKPVGTPRGGDPPREPGLPPNDPPGEDPPGPSQGAPRGERTSPFGVQGNNLNDAFSTSRPWRPGAPTGGLYGGYTEMASGANSEEEDAVSDLYLSMMGPQGGLSAQEEAAINQDAAKAARASFDASRDDIARRSARTGNAAAANAAMSELGVGQGAAGAESARKTKIELAFERQRRKETGATGLSAENRGRRERVAQGYQGLQGLYDAAARQYGGQTGQAAEIAGKPRETYVGSADASGSI